MSVIIKQKFTLEEISQRKQEVLQDIRIQHQVIADTTQEIFAPLMPSAHQGESSLIKKFNTGMAIFDGVMVGMKLLKSIRKVFRKNRY